MSAVRRRAPVLTLSARARIPLSRLRGPAPRRECCLTIMMESTVMRTAPGQNAITKGAARARRFFGRVRTGIWTGKMMRLRLTAQGKSTRSLRAPEVCPAQRSAHQWSAVPNRQTGRVRTGIWTGKLMRLRLIAQGKSTRSLRALEMCSAHRSAHQWSAVPKCQTAPAAIHCE